MVTKVGQITLDYTRDPGETFCAYKKGGRQRPPFLFHLQHRKKLIIAFSFFTTGIPAGVGHVAAVGFNAFVNRIHP